MKMHTFRHGGVGALAWTVPSTCRLAAVWGDKGYVLSTDPAMTFALWTSIGPAGAQSDETYISNGGNLIFLPNIDFELLEGQVWYSAIASSGNVQLYIFE